MSSDNDWTLFLDRDGVINQRIVGDYVKSPEEFQFIDGVPESISILNGLFRYVIVVTNQQGVGKGKMTGNDVEAVHHFMENGKNKLAEYSTGFTSAPASKLKTLPVESHDREWPCRHKKNLRVSNSKNL